MTAVSRGWDYFQNRCRAWAMACVGKDSFYDHRERCHRMLEEAVEVFQSGGCSRAEAHAIVDWKMDGQPGEMEQEIGGLLITIAVLAGAFRVSMEAAAERELARCHERMDEIRSKQVRKPRFSHLW